MPDRICLTAYAQCIESRPDDALGQTACKEDILSQCGTKSITDYESGSGGSGSGSSTEEPDSEETTDSSDENTDQETTPTDDESTPSSTDAAPTTTTSDGAGATLSAEKGIAFIAAGLVAALL